MTQTVNIASLATQIGDDVRKLKVIDSGTFAEMLPAPITITIWFLPDGDYSGIWARHPEKSWEYQGYISDFEKYAGPRATLAEIMGLADSFEVAYCIETAYRGLWARDTSGRWAGPEAR